MSFVMKADLFIDNQFSLSLKTSVKLTQALYEDSHASEIKCFAFEDKMF